MQKTDDFWGAFQAALRDGAAANAAIENSPAGKEAAHAFAALCGALRRIGRGDDLREIVATERQVMAHEREHLVTSQGQADFLDRGIEGMDIALKLIDMARGDPEHYRRIAASFQRPANRIKGLPNDEARQAFKEHRKELRAIRDAMPFGRGPFHADLTRLLEVRLVNLRQADRLYANLQREVLGGGDGRESGGAA